LVFDSTLLIVLTLRPVLLMETVTSFTETLMSTFIFLMHFTLHSYCNDKHAVNDYNICLQVLLHVNIAV